MKKNFTLIAFCSLIFLPAFITLRVSAQSSFNRDTVILAAREIIRDTKYCALTTVDSTGQPQICTMNPFPVNDELITWFATSRTSRK